MELVSATQFKRLNRNRKLTEGGIGVRKQAIAPIEQLSGELRALRFTISTGCVDREQDCIAVAGWDLANYLNNPVVLWNHDGNRLIGRGFDIRVIDGALKASVEFIPADLPEMGPLADAVYRLARSGFLGASSVGFRPLSWDYTTDKERGADDWFPGIDFHRQELVEWSVVSIPANPEALIEPATGEGVAIPGEVATDQPPTTGEEITAFDPSDAAFLASGQMRSLAFNEQEKQARAAQAQRRRVLQLVEVNSRAWRQRHADADARQGRRRG